MEGAPNNGETVYWINRFSKPTTDKILERVGIKNPADEPFQTTIPVDEIASIEDERLRSALECQKEDRRRAAGSVHIPVAYMPERRFSHGWRIPTRSLVEEAEAEAKAAQEN